MSSYPLSWMLRSGLLSACVLLGACVSQPLVVAPVQSPNDSNSYRYLVLDNQLQVLLVSDPYTDKAAASMDVNVGAGDAPADREGMPHFLEHMLFLGTEKYPDPAEYERYINEHGGYRNAYTSYAHTNYFFDIEHGHLEPALDRFSGFFTSPRFDAEYVEREKHSVDSEYKMGIKGDARRNLDVYRELFNPAHPMTLFSVGNLDTLADREGASVRDDLLDFYARWYSANIMALTVIGREPLDELEAMVRKHFSAIPNHNVVLKTIAEPLFSENSLPMLVSIEPEADVRQLQVFYPIPDYRDAYRTNPEGYLGNILGHEGEGSLLSILKADGLAESLGAGGGLGYRGGALLGITIGLTQRGLERRDEVLARLFQAIELLRREGPQQALYDEQGHIAAQAFRFREQISPDRYARGLSTNMQYYAPADVVRGGYTMDDYRPDLLAELVDHLRPEQAFIVEIAKGLSTDRNSRYYDTPYRVQAVSEGQLAGWTSATADARLAIPAANEFIATDLELKERFAANGEVPIKVVEEESLAIWFRQDDHFKVPRGGIFVTLHSPAASSHHRAIILSQLYVRLLSDAVNEFVYPASLAGLDFGVSSHGRGMSLSVEGYTDKQLALLARLLGVIENMAFNSERFIDIRERLLRDLANSKKARPYSQLLDDSRELFQRYEWDESDFAEAASDLQLEDVKAFHEAFWSSAKAKALMYGNYARADVDSLRDLLAGVLPETAQPVPQLAVTRLQDAARFVYRNPVDHDDSVYMLYFQGAENSWRQRAMAALTGQILRSEFYEQLRTEKQRGYIVFAAALPMHEVPGTTYIVQSSSTDPVQLHADVDSFLREWAADGRITPDAFARHRNALILELEEEPKNLFEQAGRYWRDLTRKRYDFDSREQLLAAVADIALEDWLTYFRQTHLEQPRSVLMYTSGRFDDPGIDRQLHEGRAAISDYQAFKAERPVYLLD